MTPLAALCLLLLAAGCLYSSPGAGAPEPRGGPEPGLRGPAPGTPPPCDGCPHHKKSATLVPAFTRTTPASTTPRPANHTTPHPANHTTPHPANHTTGHPTTPRPANHTTPHPANHTTPHPTTPRPANHTTPHPANHTTPRPTTPRPANHTTGHPTTPPPHTPPPHTTAAPPVAVGDYRVANDSAVCLRVRAGLQIRVEYTDASKARLWGAFAVRPNQTAAAGNCSSQTATLELRFPQGFLLFTFRKDATRRTFYLGGVRANLTLRFPGAVEHSFAAQTQELRDFEAGLGHSYQCENRSLALGPAFRLDALHERLQAFALRGGAFGEADLCPQPRSAWVPILIGVVLLVLIVIVLVAYLLGRRRTRGGYQTL